MKVLNFGSLNPDHVYRVARIAPAAESVGSHDHRVFAGGKGANQSVAPAAFAREHHAGRRAGLPGTPREG